MENIYIKSLGIVIILGILIIIVGIGMSVRKNTENQVPGAEVTPGGMGTPIEPEPTTPTGHPDITVNNVVPGQSIALPFTVTGTVKGTWFFENSFPVVMKDVNGTQIGVGLASSSEDWMTTNVIPFSVTLPDVDYQGQGGLLFTKDNPSGLPENDAWFLIDVVFQ